MGKGDLQNHVAAKDQVNLTPCLTSNPVNSVAPLKLGMLSIEKRLQMKQSLIKIKLKEDEEISSVLNPSKEAKWHEEDSLHKPNQDELISPSQRDDIPMEVDVSDQDREIMDVSPSIRLDSIVHSGPGSKGNLEISKLLSDECKELKRMGLDNMLMSNHRVTRFRTKSQSTSNFN
jgi:hypothetical protein